MRLKASLKLDMSLDLATIAAILLGSMITDPLAELDNSNIPTVRPIPDGNGSIVNLSPLFKRAT